MSAILNLLMMRKDILKTLIPMRMLTEPDIYASTYINADLSIFTKSDLGASHSGQQ
jgi:hypothetical protein